MRLRLPALLVVVSAIGLCAAPRASASVGELGFGFCHANLQNLGFCRDLPPVGADGPLSGAADLAVSPSGTSVYVVNAGGDASLSGGLTPFVRSATGSLLYAGCIRNAPALGCADLPPAGADGPLTKGTAITVAPDGTIYTAGLRALTRFAAGPMGQPTFAECFTADITLSPCTRIPIISQTPPTASETDVAASPDGASVYITSSDDARNVPGQLTGFSRGPDGATAFAECYAEFPGPCSKQSLVGAFTAVAVSPDSSSVYTTSDDSADGGGVSLWRRSGPGILAWGGCWADTTSSGCAKTGAGSMSDPQDVVVSPNGSSVYVAGLDGVTWLARAADGTLTWKGCLNGTGTGRCTQMPGSQIASAMSLAISPDGRSLYVAASTRLAIFEIGADGTPQYAACVSASATMDCADLPATSSSQGALGGRTHVIVSPDGKNVYTTSSANAAVGIFNRSGTDAAPSAVLRSGGSTSGGVRCRGRAATIIANGPRTNGTEGSDVIVGRLNQSDRIYGRGGNDLICGRGGNDTLYGNGGSDTLFGEGGADLLNGGLDGDFLYGGDGSDKMAGGDGKDTLIGSWGNDRLIAVSGDIASPGPGTNSVSP
jgi:DNA-binding beta-propeller fold protein YncE